MALPPGQAPRVAGLYAEGRVEVGNRQVLLLPESCIVRHGDNAFVWRVQDRVVRKVSVQLGERDARSGEVPVNAGLAAGDRILRQAGSALVDGQAVEFAPAPATPAAPASAAPKG